MEAKMREIDKQLIKSCANGKLQEVKTALGIGANINTKSDDFGDTPLIMASWKGYTEITKLLLDNGADVNTRNNKGRLLQAFMTEYLDRSAGVGR